MAVLRPFLLAILGAFVAAAPAALVPGEEAGSTSGHDQKREDTSKNDPQPSASQTIRGALVERSSDGEPETGGDEPQPLPLASFDGHRTTGTLRALPDRFLPASTRAAADLRAGLRALPPPPTRNA